jgi:VanZ family protein
MNWLALVWGGIIFTLSSIPDFEPPGPKIKYIDKLIHFGEYLIFAWLLFRREKKYKYTLHFALLFAIIDELHQKFIPGREVELLDLSMNFMGILCGWIWWRVK